MWREWKCSRSRKEASRRCHSPWSWLDFDAISPRSFPEQGVPKKTSTEHCNVRITLPSGWSSAPLPVCAQGQPPEEGQRPSTASWTQGTLQPSHSSTSSWGNRGFWLHSELSHGVQFLAPFACFAMWVKNARVVSAGSLGTERPGSQSTLRQKSRGCALHAGY